MANRNGYSAKLKEQTLKTLERQGIWAACAESGAHHTTIYRWHAEHVRTLNQSPEEIEAELQVQSAIRAHVQRRLLETALAHLDRSDHCKNGRDAKDFMTAAAIAMDKFRLEKGEAVHITENRPADAAEVAKQRVDELAERRTKSA